MTSGYYVLLYGLAEALTLSLVLTILFAVLWWKQRHALMKLRRTSKAIANLLKAKLAKLDQAPTTRPELRATRLMFLDALAQPFSKRLFGEESAWIEALDNLEHCFDELPEIVGDALDAGAQGVPAALAPGAAHSTDEALSGQLDSGIEAILARNAAGVAAIKANREATAELKRNYEQLQMANQELRMKLQADKTGELWQAFEAQEQSKAAFMQTLAVKERSYKLLVQEYEGLQVHLQNLQTTIGSYRKSVHKLLLERDTVTEENKQLREQHDASNKLVARLNRNYDGLRKQYNELFELTHPDDQTRNRHG